LSVDEVEVMLNRRSGMLGLVGEWDLRRVRKAIESGCGTAKLAHDVFLHPVRG
jgi:acetate kinase